MEPKFSNVKDWELAPLQQCPEPFAKQTELTATSKMINRFRTILRKYQTNCLRWWWMQILKVKTVFLGQLKDLEGRSVSNCHLGSCQVDSWFDVPVWTHDAFDELKSDP
jgi:hypothetical protein